MGCLEERATESLVAAAAAAVFPIHLDEPVKAAQSLIELRTLACSGCGTEAEVALIRIFLSGVVEPGIQIRIGDGLFGFMSNHVGHAVRATVVVQYWGLRFVTPRALVHVADERAFNTDSSQGLESVESAERTAESVLFDVGRGQKQIDAIRIGGQISRCKVTGNGR